MFTAVIFDMDGLMFDTERLNAEAWLTVGIENGIPLTHDIIKQTVGQNPENTMGIFKSHIADLPDFYELREQRIQHVKRYIVERGIPVKHGLRELLKFLKQNGYRIALATSTPRLLASYYLDTSELTGYFDQLVFGDMIHRPKPAPDIYIKACELLGAAPAECLTLEDSPVGVKAAYLAGTKPVMIPDLIQLDAATGAMLYACFDSLLDVIPLLKAAQAQA